MLLWHRIKFGGLTMKMREKARIKRTIEELKEFVKQLEGKDKENLLNRIDALEWVLTIAEE